MVFFLTTMLLFLGCSRGVNYSKSLFRHIPDDPQLLVLVNPNDISRLVEMAVSELDFGEILGGKVDIDTAKLDHYKDISVEMMKALGLPWERIETIGFLLYFDQPVFLVSGDFRRDQVTDKMKSLGFRQHDNGFFDYVYDKQKLSIPDDGLMMMAQESLLDDLQAIPEANRLWNREDFVEYRLRSPLTNSLFVWTHPPKDFLPDFEYRDDLGDISLALNFKRNFSFKATIRVKDPQKTVLLHDLIYGISKVANGIFGSDPDYGPILNGINVTQNNHQVDASLVIPPEKVRALRDRLRRDFQNDETSTFENIEKFLNKFK